MPAPYALASSFRDPSGFVFRYQDELYRTIFPTYQAHYEHLMQSGLYEALVEAEQLIPHESVSLELSFDPQPWQIIRPEAVPFISYPYEWTFHQYRSAALCTLDILEKSLARGMVLKDASAYNLAFYRGKCCFIDTLSFEIRNDQSPWQAYGQFCRHFLAPLALMSYRDPSLVKLMQVHIDGVPLRLASRLLPWRSRLRPFLLTHLHLHARGEGKSDKASFAKTRKSRFSQAAFQGLIHSLRKAVQSLPKPKSSPTWVGYYQDEVAKTYQAAKTQQIKTWLADLRPAYTWDLGANTGHYSRLAATYGLTLALESDHASLDVLSQALLQKTHPHLLPVYSELTNPSPGLGWRNQERDALLKRPKPKLVMALALVHHLCLTHHISFAQLGAWLAELAPRLIIEFVPAADPQVQRLITSRPEVLKTYHQEAFETAFASYFRQLEPITLPGGRLLYCLQSLSS